MRPILGIGRGHAPPPARRALESFPFNGAKRKTSATPFEPLDVRKVTTHRSGVASDQDKQTPRSALPNITNPSVNDVDNGAQGGGRTRREKTPDTLRRAAEQAGGGHRNSGTHIWKTERAGASSR
ncbi:hypothetical protein BIW11_09842 [Tropilaelaps mercedesae]|uniref:Uncharacterized protein n=1 Tax=Tropilaelaps mercedesae TaxID=418985 RepID=A0A1V9XIQ7_9ACAR|nr:hypothetical protein BIW11_09842 [Tropilaelaps mercedesae]